MHRLADSHIHLFNGGYLKSGVDEVTEYEILLRKFPIDAALVVGYEGQPWARGNNNYIAELAKTREWIYPVAFLFPEQLTLTHLESLQSQNFIGISLYIFTEEEIDQINHVSDEVWRWLSNEGWLISLNSQGAILPLWESILKKFPELYLLLSHLSLPRVSSETPSEGELVKELANQRALYQFENVHIKMSGYYSFETSTPRFPYKRIEPYVKYILNNFDSSRLIWGSDFTPALADVTFEETFIHLNQWVANDDLRSKVLHGNLMKLLRQ